MNARKRGRGRPPKKASEKASERIEIRCSADELNHYKRAAELSELALSAWMKEWLNHGANEELGS